MRDDRASFVVLRSLSRTAVTPIPLDVPRLDDRHKGGGEDVEAERGKEAIATPGDRDFASACRLLEAGADDHTIAAALAAVRGFDTKCPGGYLPRTASSPNTRAAYGGALRRLAAWLDGRPLDDRTLTAYLDSLREAGRAQATAAIVVAAVRHAVRDAGEASRTAR